MQRLTRRDWGFIGICVAVLAISLAVALTNFTRAFPEASIEFRYDRSSSRGIAEGLLRNTGVDIGKMRNTAVFNVDDPAKIFLERKLGLDTARNVMKHDVRLWSWHHRWFRPLEEEEVSVDVAPTGEIIGFHHRIPEDRAMASPPIEAARANATTFLTRARVDVSSLRPAGESERRLPHRTERIFTWDASNVHPAGAPYRYSVAVDGAIVTAYEQKLRVPDQWQRTYQELRSKNLLAGQVDGVFLALTIIAGLIVFIVRLRRRDIDVKFVLGIAIASIVLVTGVSLNSFPSALAGYDTTTSYSAFLAQFVIGALLESFGTAMLLIVICGSGEVLYRERLPQHLAIPRLWNRRALGSKRVFLALVLGYTMVAFFLAYQVVFYIVASKFGAWAPADVPYDDILNSALPWVAVLFAGFFPALSEEFMSRALSLPLLERILRSRFGAIVLAGFIWGFGHATYPNQPFYIRGVEVGCAGVILGFIFYRFGLLPLLIWHYTVDAVYTALLLFRSHNAYYVTSAAASSFVFAIPMLISIALYLKRGGFTPDDDLSNATLPVSAPPPPRIVEPAAELPPAMRPRSGAWLICGAAVALAAILVALSPPSPSDATDYRINRAEAKRIAAAHLARVMPDAHYSRIIATPRDGFSSWNAGSGREDGGGPGGFDSTAAEAMLSRGLTMSGLVDVFRNRVEAATWTVRFFTAMQKQEFFVEVDPRTGRVVGFHKYLEEALPGPRLEQAQALAIALSSFPPYGVDTHAFELKEALAFQQPARRDWLFHFQERRPIVEGAYRRITVRVCGATVTQFANTIKVPDAVYRAASTETLRNVVLMVLRIAGSIALLTFIVTGFVTAAGQRRPRWLLALRWTLILSPLPILTVASGYESMLFGYGTSVKWDTFYAGLALGVARDVALRIAVLFLAIAAIDAVVPFALGAVSRVGRRRFGRSAAIAAVTAVAAYQVVHGMMQLIAARFPAAANVSLGIPQSVSINAPALVAVASAVFAAIAAAGVAAAFIGGIALLRQRRWLPDVVGVAVIFCAAIDSSSTFEQMPLMLVRAAVLALATWGIARWILGANPLAWPAAVFTGSLANEALQMAANHRSDLQIQSAILLGVIVVVLIGLGARVEEGPLDA